MRSYTLFDEKNVTTDWVSEELAEGNCSTSFGSMGKYWAFYSDGRLWEATLFENSRHELRLVNRDYMMKCDITCMMDRLQRLSDTLDEFRLEVGWDGKDTLIVRPYYAEEPFTLLEVLEKSRVQGIDYLVHIPRSGAEDLVYTGIGLTVAGRFRFKDALSLPTRISKDGTTIIVGSDLSNVDCCYEAHGMFYMMKKFNQERAMEPKFRSIELSTLFNI